MHQFTMTLWRNLIHNVTSYAYGRGEDRADQPEPPSGNCKGNLARCQGKGKMRPVSQRLLCSY